MMSEMHRLISCTTAQIQLIYAFSAKPTFNNFYPSFILSIIQRSVLDNEPDEI